MSLVLDFHVELYFWQKATFRIVDNHFSLAACCVTGITSRSCVDTWETVFERQTDHTHEGCDRSGQTSDDRPSERAFESSCYYLTLISLCFLRLRCHVLESPKSILSNSFESPSATSNDHQDLQSTVRHCSRHAPFTSRQKHGALCSAQSGDLRAVVSD